MQLSVSPLAAIRRGGFCTLSRCVEELDFGHQSSSRWKLVRRRVSHQVGSEWEVRGRSDQNQTSGRSCDDGLGCVFQTCPLQPVLLMPLRARGMLSLSLRYTCSWVRLLHGRQRGQARGRRTLGMLTAAVAAIAATRVLDSPAPSPPRHREVSGGRICLRAGSTPLTLRPIADLISRFEKWAC